MLYILVPLSLTYCEMVLVRMGHGCTFSLRSRCHQSQVLRLWLCEFPQFLGKHRIVSSCAYSYGIYVIQCLFLWLPMECMLSMKTRSRCSWCCFHKCFKTQPFEAIHLLFCRNARCWWECHTNISKLFLMTHYESLWYLDHSGFQAILTAQTVWCCPSVVTLEVLVMQSEPWTHWTIPAFVVDRAWALAGGFGTLPLWSFNVIEFIACEFELAKAFRCRIMWSQRLLMSILFFFVISGFAFAFASVPDSRLTLHG